MSENNQQLHLNKAAEAGERQIIVTSALPYANGPIHLGHLVEYLQMDFWARFQKMRGHDCHYMCADDTHGTPIMIRARSLGISPEELIKNASVEHQRDFRDFQIEFDHYSSTHSDENRRISEQIYFEMLRQGHIEVKKIQQLYCETDQMFLPDRFVRGECPRCKAPDQYGDSCSNCSATYQPMEMKNVRCSICGNTPVLRDSEHVFFQLEHFRDFLREWVPAHTQTEVTNKLNEWLTEELRAWDISRDQPYFGFKIPGYPDKFFYVWVDAPVGYISTTDQWCRSHGRDFHEFWKNPKAEIYHCVGKDIIYFHCLFWPAMLKLSGFQTPTKVFVHGFLKVNGEKMSKSKGTFIEARTYLNHLDPTYLRYYYASKLSRGLDDLDLNIEDFVNRVNSDLIGKITNLGSRSLGLLHSKLDGRLGRLTEAGVHLVRDAQNRQDKIASYYEERDFQRAINEIREIADLANRQFDEQAPWKLVKTDPEQTRHCLTDAINLFRLMCIYLKPILPLYAAKVSELLSDPGSANNTSEFQWSSLDELLEDLAVRTYSHLVQRVDIKAVQEILKPS